MRLIALFVLALAACPPKDDGKAAPAPAASCAKFGQSCELSPGKLGTCVQREGCTEGTCLVCQSQH